MAQVSMGWAQRKKGGRRGPLATRGTDRMVGVTPRWRHHGHQLERHILAEANSEKKLGGKGADPLSGQGSAGGDRFTSRCQRAQRGCALTCCVPIIQRASARSGSVPPPHRPAGPPPAAPGVISLSLLPPVLIRPPCKGLWLSLLFFQF